MRGQQTHKWYGRWVGDWNTEDAAVRRRDPKTFGKCDHAVRFPGINYEIGLVKDPDGTFALVYDSWGTGGQHDGRKLVEKLGGLKLPKMVDEYSAAVSTRVLARKGFRVTRTTGSKGEIVLRATN